MGRSGGIHFDRASQIFLIISTLQRGNDPTFSFELSPLSFDLSPLSFDLSALSFHL